MFLRYLKILLFFISCIHLQLYRAMQQPRKVLAEASNGSIELPPYALQTFETIKHIAEHFPEGDLTIPLTDYTTEEIADVVEASGGIAGFVKAKKTFENCLMDTTAKRISLIAHLYDPCLDKWSKEQLYSWYGNPSSLHDWMEKGIFQKRKDFFYNLPFPLQKEVIKTLLGHNPTLLSYTPFGSFANKSIRSLLAHGNKLIAGASDGTVEVWNYDSNTKEHAFKAHDNVVSALAAEDDYLVSGSHDKSVKVWDLKTFNHINTFLGHKGWITCLAIEKNLGVSGSYDGKIRINDLNSLNSYELPTGYNLPVQAVIIKNNKIYCAQGNVVQSLLLAEGTIAQQVRYEDVGWFKVNALALYKNRLIGAMSSGELYIWDANEGKKIGKFEGWGKGIKAFLITPKEHLIAAYEDKKIRINPLEAYNYYYFSVPDKIRALATYNQHLFVGTDAGIQGYRRHDLADYRKNLNYEQLLVLTALLNECVSKGSIDQSYKPLSSYPQVQEIYNSINNQALKTLVEEALHKRQQALR